jgi:hypothetical protein
VDAGLSVLPEETPQPTAAAGIPTVAYYVAGGLLLAIFALIIVVVTRRRKTGGNGQNHK